MQLLARANHWSRVLLCTALVLVSCRDPSRSAGEWRAVGSGSASPDASGSPDGSGSASPDANGSPDGAGSGSGDANPDSGTDGPLEQCFAGEQEILLSEEGSVMDGVVDDFSNDCMDPESIDCQLAPYAATPGDPDCLQESEEPDQPDGTDAYPCRPWATLREDDQGRIYGALYSECAATSTPMLTYTGASGSVSVPLAYEGMTQDEATHHWWELDGSEPFNPTFRISVNFGAFAYTLVPDVSGESCAAGGVLGPTVAGIGCSVDLFPEGFVSELANTTRRD